MMEEEYEQEFECSFAAALTGAYYGKIVDDIEEKKQLTNVPHDPQYTVQTYWDLGIDDSTAIWFIQQVGKAYHVIDYLEDSGLGLPEYAQLLLSGHRSRYNYEDHFLPHDGSVRDLGTGISRQQILQNNGLKPTLIVPKHNPADGIAAVRRVLPMCYFDLIRCEKGLDALRNYERRYDTKNKIWSSKPLHNWASHGSDAFRTFAMGIREPQSKRGMGTLSQDTGGMDFDLF